MEFFDVNCLVNRGIVENILKKESREDIFSLLLKNNITKSVFTNSLSLSYDWNIGNNDLLSFMGLSQNNSIYFGFVLTPDVYHQFVFSDYMENAYKNKARLFRIFPKSHLFYLNDFYMRKIYNEMAEVNFPLMLDLKELDITGNKYFAIDDLKVLLGENKKLPVILETSLKQCMFNRFYFPLMEEFENLYLEVSGMLLMDQIEHYVSKFGSERLIFGSNFPNTSLEVNTSRIESADIDESAKENIGGKNITRLLEKIGL
jgi:predicted TIM-barrel fold metal-dependent hydrolase